MATVGRPKRGVPEGLWIRCPQCKATIFRKEAETRFNVCPECNYHFYVAARERIRQLLDEESFEEWFTNLWPRDALGFRDRLPYAERLKAEQSKTGMPDAAVVGRGYIRGRPVVFVVTDFSFMAGSMGSVVGEKIARAAEAATRLELPLIIVSGSRGGEFRAARRHHPRRARRHDRLRRSPHHPRDHSPGVARRLPDQ